MTGKLQLYSYWRSSAAWRVRIALVLKGVDYDVVPINLIADGGQQHSDSYAALNAQHLVPTLALQDGTKLTQSLAIMDWLETTHPSPALLPSNAFLRARVISAAHVVAMDIHPINNLRVLNCLASQFGASAEAKTSWMQHWMKLGFDALENDLKPGTFAFGNTPTLADVCLVPQLYNARRWGMDVTAWPKLAMIEAGCMSLAAFKSTAPETQPDAT